ncbi:MAG: DUF883 domain-containing protein [Burkholderiaceae bacterium]|nr:DUF883 domain-containing protein [Burkholderiaceae bacterium]
MSDNTDAVDSLHRERLTADLRALMAEAEQLLQAMAGQSGEGADELRKRVRASLERSRQHLLELQQNAVDKAKAAGRATDAYVHEKPWQSVGIAASVAAGVGLLVGMLIARR